MTENVDSDSPSSPKPRAPKPPTELRGGYSSRDPKASEVPHDPPTYFPKELWAQTNLILLKAQREFPLQKQTLELCRYVTSEMTPLFADAVKAGNIKAYAVQQRDGGGMEDLLRLLLMCNDSGVKSGFGGLSDTAYHLGEQVRQSEEWLAMAEAIVEAQHSGQPSIDETSRRSAMALEVSVASGMRPVPDVTKRREIVRQNLQMGAHGLCQLFDAHQIPLPTAMAEAGTWEKALKAPRYKHPVESLISRDKNAVRGK